MPWLKGGAQFDVDVALSKVADARKAKLKMRREPLELKRVSALAQVPDDVAEIVFTKVRQHPTIMDVSAPADERVCIRFTPEPGDKTAQEKMLSQAHASVG